MADIICLARNTLTPMCEGANSFLRQGAMRLLKYNPRECGLNQSVIRSKRWQEPVRFWNIYQGRINSVNYKLALAIYLYKNWLRCQLQLLLTLTLPGKKFRVERNETLCALGKTGRMGLQIGIFRSWFYEPNFLHLPISTKAPKSFMVMTDPSD